MDLSLLLCTSLMFAGPSAAAPSDTMIGPEPVAPVPDRDYSLRVNRRARGLGIGFSQGLWGRGFGQTLRFDIPFGRRVGQFFGARLAGTIVHAESTLADGAKRWDPSVFGAVELFGRSPVMGGIVRVYGGGGLHFGGRPVPTPQGAKVAVGGGGHMGIEAFASPRVAFSVEIGGQRGVHGLGHDGGASVMGGVNLYFGR
ncbi:MAG: hypothetical protein AAF721_35035 [Myxococcota bacterium]